MEAPTLGKSLLGFQHIDIVFTKDKEKKGEL